MPQRYFNWKLAVVLVIGCTVLAITAVGLRKWRNANSAKNGLILGNKAYEEHDWEEAAKSLGRYIAINQNDVEVLKKYADAQLKIRPSSGNHIKQAAETYRIVLRIEPDNFEVAEQLTELYFLLRDYSTAELIAGRQLETNPNPELSRLHAISLTYQRKFKEAADELKELCSKYPDQILAFETTGQLAEQHPEEFTEPASYWYDEAVKNNPSSALAYIVRAGYYRRNKENNSAISQLEEAEKQELSKSEVSLRLAMEYINLNLLDKAEKILDKVREMSPGDQGLWQMLAQTALMSKSKEKMLETAQSGLKELSTQPWDFIPIASELFIRAGEFEKAEHYISQLKEKNFEPSSISYLEGLLSAEKGDFLNASKLWEYSIESGNNSTRVRLELASAQLKSGNTQSAINNLDKLVEERPDSFEGLLMLAKVLVQTGNWVEALEYAQKAIQLAPENQEALLLQIQAQIQIVGSSSEISQNLQNIEKNLTMLDSEGTSSVETGLLRYQIEMRKGNYTKAQEILNQLKQKYPSQVNVYQAEAELYAAQEKIDEAITILRQTIEKFPEASGPVKYLAALLDTQGKKDACIEVITQALNRIEEQSVQRDLNLLLAAFYNRWNQKDKAYEQLEMIARKFPNDITIKRNLLSCEQVIEKSAKAQQLVDEIKKLEGDDGWQWRYEQARIWYLSDSFKEYYTQIVTLIQKNIFENPSDQGSRLLLAKTYEKAGELQLAITTYREALNRTPGSVQLLTTLVSALYKIKEYDQAEELLKRVPQQSLQDPQLQRLQFQSYLRQGQFESASDILQDYVGNDPNNHEASLALALLDMQQGKYTEAGQRLSKLRVNDPCSLPIASAQIQLNLKLNESQQALQVCDELVNNLKNSSAYILRARTYAALNQKENSLKDLDSAISIEPGNAQVWMARSDFFVASGDKEKALDDIRKALSLDSENAQIQKRTITLLLTSNRPDMISEGKNIIEQALKKNPEDVDLRQYKANLLFSEGTAPAIENARQILQEIIHNNPEYSQAWLLLGEIMMKKEQAGTAMDYASRGLAYKPNDEDLLFLKARAEAVRSPVLAVPTLKVLCDLNPNNVEAVSFLANTYVNTNEPAKAVSFLQNILTKCNESNTRAYNVSLAAALYKAGSKEDALNKFNSLMTENSQDPAPLLAQVYLLRDDKLWSELQAKTLDWYQQHPENSHALITIAGNLISNESVEAKKIAEELLRAVIKNNPENTQSLYSLAILFSMTGRSDEAADIYRKLLDIDPENVVAINNLAWIMCENQGQPQQALELAQKGLKQAPDYIDLIDTRGMIYFRLGKFQEAVHDFSRCIELYPESSPQSVASRFHLAKAYAGLKNNVRAIGYLKDVLNSKEQIGGLTAKEIAEAQSLLTQLQEEI
ncbi:MAG: tetratricopeptide repeat protein [Sedimentisphaerales bacterium]|nr:tetratricopeptide repeat protein [Sedimentisphaerales bacterium]